MFFQFTLSLHFLREAVHSHQHLLLLFTHANLVDKKRHLSAHGILSASEVHDLFLRPPFLFLLGRFFAHFLI